MGKASERATKFNVDTVVIFGLIVFWVARPEALGRAWVSDIRHALRKASERATPKFNVDAVVIFVLIVFGWHARSGKGVVPWQPQSVPPKCEQHLKNFFPEQ